MEVDMMEVGESIYKGSIQKYKFGVYVGSGREMGSGGC